MTIPDQYADISVGTTVSPYGFGEPADVFELPAVESNVPSADVHWIYIIKGPEVGTMVIDDPVPRTAGTSSAWLIRYLKNSIDKMSSTSSSPTARTPRLPPHSDPKTTSRAIFELRRISGLDWDELAQLFEVSRDTIHSWASRKPLDVGEKTQIMKALDVVRYVDRGSSRATRKALHGVDADTGKSPFELLVEQRFDEASKALGEGTPMHRPKLGELDQKSKDARKPLPLEVLLNARQDRIHEDLGRTRVVRSVRKKRRDDT